MLTRKTAVKLKAAALTADYTQSIGAPALNTLDPAHPREQFRHPPYGTLYVCGPKECETLQIAGYVIDKTGLQRLSNFDVDPGTGVVAHFGNLLEADAAIASRMKAACRK